MSHEQSLGIVTGLVLLASVLAMIGSLDRASRLLRGPQSALPAEMSVAHLAP
jgi:hypothetical protein